MAFTSSGYGGTLTEGPWRALWAAVAEYGVIDAGDWRASVVPSADRTVSLAAGTGWGKGILDTSTAPAQVQCGPIASGFRWDLVVARRNASGSGGTTTFAVVQGTSDPGAAFGLRNVLSPATTTDDQPLHLVRVEAGSSVPTDMRDVRLWQANGGAFAATYWPNAYLTRPGSTFRTATNMYHRIIDASGVATWDIRPLAAGAWVPLTLVAGWAPWGAAPAVRIWEGRAWYRGSATRSDSSVIPSTYTALASGVTLPPGYPPMTLDMPIGSNGDAAFATVGDGLLYVRASSATRITLDGMSHGA